MAVDEVERSDLHGNRVTKKPEAGWGPEFDENGKILNPKRIGGWNPTARFHPSELPADPVARAAFPKELIDENAYTQSPMSDVPPERRREVAVGAMADAHLRLESTVDSMTARQDAANEALGDDVRAEVESRKADRDAGAEETSEDPKPIVPASEGKEAPVKA